MIDKLRNFLVRYKYSFIKGYDTSCSAKKYRALLYYKTTPFVLDGDQSFKHTNNSEIIEMANTLNRFGFVVDIIDRNIDPSFMPDDKYDLFIGNAAGNSGKHYVRYAQHLTKATKIFYAAGPEPETSNQLTNDRYDIFEKRNNIQDNATKRLRCIDYAATPAAMEYTDFIFAIGNEFSINTYAHHNKPTYRIYPSSSPAIQFYPSQLKSSDTKNFLYFGGNGHVVKGLDLVIEAFAECPDLNLYICGPDYKEEFGDMYDALMKKHNNMHFIGFVDVDGPVFRELTQKCGFIILPSCSEGTATSVTTCMRAGLVPITTYESGIDLGDFGFSISDIEPEKIRDLVKHISNISFAEYKDRAFKTYIESYNYTPQGFKKSFEEALEKVMIAKGL